MNRAKFSERYRSRREAARATRALDLAWRTVIFVIGGTLLGLGLFFLIFPGPGWATIILGLVILGTEFQWAIRLLEPLQNATRKARSATTNQSSQRGRIAFFAVLTVALAIAFVTYPTKFGFTVQPLFNLRSWFHEHV